MDQSVVLVRVPLVESRWVSATIVSPPIGMAYIASSLLEAKIDVRCVDSTGEAPFQKNIIVGTDLYSYGLSVDEIVQKVGSSDVIGVSVGFSNTWPLAKEIIRKIRKQNPGSWIICGGEHITAIPEFCLSDCPEIDICVLGEGDETMVALVQAKKQNGDLALVKGIYYNDNGAIKKNERRGRIKEIDQIPWPAWHLIPLENYLSNGLGYGINPGRSMPLLATRGCPFRCTFCSNPTMWNAKWQARDVRDVLDEIQHYVEKYGAQNIDFYDLTTVIRKDWIIEFCKGAIARNLNVRWQMPSGTRSEALDAEVLELMSQAGVQHLVYAPESGSDRTLKEVKKKIDLDKMTDSVRAAMRFGIKVKLNIVIGFPKDTKMDIFKTYLFLIKMAYVGVTDVIVNTFMPYPGSELFESLLKEGRIEDSFSGGKISNLSDSYFWGLIYELSRAKSYSRTIKSFELVIYKISGMAIFYSASFLIRPFRLFRVAYNVSRNIEESRLESVLIQIKDRFFKKRVVKVN